MVQILNDALSIVRKGENVEITHPQLKEPFKVGELVKVFDGSHNQEVSLLLTKRNGIDPLFKDLAEVIRVGEPVVEAFPIGDTYHFIRLDLMLRFPNGTKIWCSSICVRRLKS